MNFDITRFDHIAMVGALGACILGLFLWALWTFGTLLKWTGIRIRAWALAILLGCGSIGFAVGDMPIDWNKDKDRYNIDVSNARITRTFVTTDRGLPKEMTVIEPLHERRLPAWADGMLAGVGLALIIVGIMSYLNPPTKPTT